MMFRMHAIIPTEKNQTVRDEGLNTSACTEFKGYPSVFLLILSLVYIIYLSKSYLLRRRRKIVVQAVINLPIQYEEKYHFR